MTNHEDNRVLNRIGARVLTLAETDRVSGGRHNTTSLCTIDETTKARDGDPGECS
jgi:hypothetical protein